ncbi:MAG TPA: hypothetical protein VFV72_05660 [Candidatus Limnocylindrales bacterium]|nr:hypothetical protein [Candidatus Limnocylindrales bacterium]
MTVSGSGLQDSGIDRALQVALEAELDQEITSGELWPGEREQFPEPIPPGEANRPWQMPIRAPRGPTAAPPIGAVLGAAVRGQAPPPPPSATSDTDSPRPIKAVPSYSDEAYEAACKAEIAKKPRKKRYLTWRSDRVGIVMIHGIGPQLAGQTLLDWTRPIIEALRDAPEGDRRLDVPPASARNVTDPVAKSNIDFSGETFPVLQVRVPRLNGVAQGDPRGRERTWVFTEAWWASEVRAPTLPTMISWLGEQGGVGRIVQGIQENSLGAGLGAIIGRISLQPIVSVITSFVLLLFFLLLGIAKIIPFGPLRDAVVLRLAASFLTDWFGGARTLLLDAGQSANVRHRLLMTIKALRAYGCRDVVIIAHSGGTMASLTTLTDPAFANLRVQKLITIGEALNLGWRLNDENPDDPPPTPPTGDRMAADLGKIQPELQWRDFWATHDPAPAGRPQLPRTFEHTDFPRFTAERVYNRMSILEDHGGYWDNDEHFVIPLIREIDVPTGDRTASRFYGDREESYLRSRRKERVSLLALWRRALLSLPLVGILAAATVSSPGFVPTAGGFALRLFGLIPGNELVAGVGDAVVSFFKGLSLENMPLIPSFLQVPSLFDPLYTLGTWALEAILIVLLLFALLPGRVDRLWANAERGARPRFLLLVLDFAVGIGVFVMVVTGFVMLSSEQRAAILNGISLGPVIALIAFGVLAGVVGWAGPKARSRLRKSQAKPTLAQTIGRNAGIALSALALGAILIGLLVVVVGVVLVLIDGSTPEHLAIEQFVIGSIAILFAFSLIGRLGTWRWTVWDVRERRMLRRAPLKEPPRLWPYFVGTVLSVIVFAAMSVVALGAPGSSWLGIELATWLVLIGVGIVLVVLFSLAKDIVDNDIAVDTGRDPGGGGEPSIVTSKQPPPAPSSRS